MYSHNSNWNDWGCNNSARFVCKLEQASNLNEVLRSDDSMNYADAVNWCAARGLTIVDVHSQEDTNVILSTINGRGDAWIGFTDGHDEGNFKWENNSPVDYTNWNGGEPNNHNGNEHCTEARQHDGKWNDSPCSNNRNALCKVW